MDREKYEKFLKSYRANPEGITREYLGDVLADAAAAEQVWKENNMERRRRITGVVIEEEKITVHNADLATTFAGMGTTVTIPIDDVAGLWLNTDRGHRPLHALMLTLKDGTTHIFEPGEVLLTMFARVPNGNETELDHRTAYVTMCHIRDMNDTIREQTRG